MNPFEGMKNEEQAARVAEAVQMAVDHITRPRKPRWRLNNSREVTGCRELGCYSATLGPFCVGCARMYQPEEVAA